MKTPMMMMLSLLVCATFFVGCKSSECSQMSECCGDVRGLEGLGEACGPLAEQTTNPDSCRSVTETVRYMLKDRKKDIPPSCK